MNAKRKESCGRELFDGFLDLVGELDFALGVVLVLAVLGYRDFRGTHAVANPQASVTFVLSTSERNVSSGSYRRTLTCQSCSDGTERFPPCSCVVRPSASPHANLKNASNHSNEA